MKVLGVNFFLKHSVVSPHQTKGLWQYSDGDPKTGRRMQGVCNKKLSCRREAARCFVLLNILLCYSSSVKVIRNHTL